MSIYKITITKMEPHDEHVTQWRIKSIPETIYESKYDIPEEYRGEAVSHQRFTGKTKYEEKVILEQTVENDMNDFITNIIKSINTIE